MSVNKEEITYRNHWYFLSHHPGYADGFHWFVIVYAPCEKLAVDSHWLRTREDAITWANRLIDSIYDGTRSDFILGSMKAGVIPEVKNEK